MDTLIVTTDFSALNSSTLTMKLDCVEQKSGYYGTATLRECSFNIGGEGWVEIRQNPEFFRRPPLL